MKLKKDRFELNFLMCAFLCSATGNEEQLNSSHCLPNELLLSLFHTSLENELSDREIPLADGDHVAFMHHILERERDGHVAPFSLPVIKGLYESVSRVSLEVDDPIIMTGELLCSLFYQFLCRLGFFRGEREACRETGHDDVILHGRQQQRGDGVNQHFTGELPHLHKTKPVSRLSVSAVLFMLFPTAARDDLLKPLNV